VRRFRYRAIFKFNDLRYLTSFSTILYNLSRFVSKALKEKRGSWLHEVYELKNVFTTLDTPNIPSICDFVLSLPAFLQILLLFFNVRVIN
jgi:hypothetical protein